MDCDEHVRQASTRRKRFAKLEEQHVKIYEFEVYGGSGMTIQLPIIGAYCSRISPKEEAEHTVWCLMMESLQRHIGSVWTFMS